MSVMLEERYQINGTNSWIHCLPLHVNPCHHTPYHYHEYVEVLLFFSGEGIVWVNGKPNRFSQNDLIIINAERAHMLEIEKEAEYICIKVMPSILYSDERFCDEFRYVLPFLSEVQNEYFFTEEEATVLHAKRLLTEILKEWQSMDYGFELAIKSMLLEFFWRVLRYLRRHDSVAETTVIKPEIKKAILYLTDRYATVNEKEVADLCHLSYPHFSYLFKKTIGKNFKDYLLDLKIRQAEKLLLSTEKSVTEIAQDMNFSTASHFITQFKKKTGITPQKFRKTLYE